MKPVLKLIVGILIAVILVGGGMLFSIYNREKEYKAKVNKIAHVVIEKGEAIDASRQSILPFATA